MKGRGEDALAAWLQPRLQAAMQDATVALRLHPQREAEGNKSPDFVLDMEVRVPLFDGLPLVVNVPILLEVEAAGFDGALMDLERYVTRSVDGSGRQAPAIALPFVVATEAAAGQRMAIVRQLPVQFRAVEIAIPQAKRAEWAPEEPP